MIIILYSFILLSVYWVLRIVVSFFWVKKSQKIFNVINKDVTSPFILVIPVLDEKDIILDTIDYFLNLIKPFPGSKILIVTTNKEKKIHKEKQRLAIKFVNSRSKKDIVSFIKFNFAIDLNNYSNIKLLKSKAMEIINNDKDTIDILDGVQNSNVIIINYPYTVGKMAHQLNFCLRLIIKNKLWTDELLGIYNADSRPDKSTLLWLNSKNNHSEQVFQQYGNYFGNINYIINKKFFNKVTLFSSVVWQNRWSLGFEIFNNLKQFIFSSRHIIGESFLYPLNYCIGHGLFFTRSIFEKQSFTEDTHNEDAIFGLNLSYNRKKIIPIPFFDSADSPDSITSLFLQKSSWFFGPVQAPLYYKKLKASIIKVDKLRLFFLSSMLFSHAIFWLLGPSCLLLLLLNAVVTLNFKWFLIGYFSFLVLPNFLAYMFFPYKKIKALNALIFLSVGSFFAYMIHGASAYYSIFLMIRSFFTKENIYKYKTKILRDKVY